MPSTVLSFSNLQLYKDTLFFIRSYFIDSNFRREINDKNLNKPKAFYKGRPIALYLYLIASLDPKFKGQIRFPKGNFTDYHKSLLLKLCADFYFSRAHKDLSKIIFENTSHVLTEEDAKELDIIEAIKDQDQKQQALEKFIDQKHEQEESLKPKTKPPETKPVTQPTDQQPETQEPTDHLEPITPGVYLDKKTDQIVTSEQLITEPGQQTEEKIPEQVIKILNDPYYLELKDELTKEWLQDHPSETVTAKDKSGLQRDAYYLYLVRKEDQRVNRFHTDNKIYPQVADDPEVKIVRAKILEEGRQAYLAKARSYPTSNVTQTKIEDYTHIASISAWDKFVLNFPTKAQTYAQEDKDIREAYQRYLKTSRQKAKQLEEKSPQLFTPTSIGQPQHQATNIAPLVFNKPESAAPTAPKDQIPPLTRLQPTNRELRSLIRGEESPKLEPEIVTPPSLPPQIKSPIKDLLSNAQIFTKNASSVIARGIGSGIRSLGGALLRLGNAALSTGLRAAVGIAGTTAAAIGWPLIIAGIILLAAFVIIPILFIPLSKHTPLLFPFDEENISKTTSPTTFGSGSLNSCQFTRAGVSKPVISSKLQAIFAEVSQKSGIPASVLASIAMHENQTFTSSATDEHDAFKNIGFTGPECQPHFATSPTGALGFMQVQPPNSILARAHPGAYDLRGISKGLEWMGKSLDSLTLQDFCDIRTSVYMGAGVLWSKNKGKVPETSQEVYEATRGYYGACGYQNVYNYCDEVKRDFENCQVTQTTPPTGLVASCPVPNGVIGCASYGKPYSSSGFGGVCRPDPTGNGGHCNANYRSSVGICSNYISNGNLIRTAKSIDVASPNGSRAGDPIYMPSLKGKDVKWYYKGSLNAGAGFGGMRLYESERTEDGIYSLQFVHVNESSPAMSLDQELKSGDVGATMYPLSDYVHVHITIGLNIGPNSAGNDKLYSPGWLFPDRDLGMCTRKAEK